jgi:hypothetical protein
LDEWCVGVVPTFELLDVADVVERGESSFEVAVADEFGDFDFDWVGESALVREFGGVGDDGAAGVIGGSHHVHIVPEADESES